MVSNKTRGQGENAKCECICERCIWQKGLSTLKGARKRDAGGVTGNDDGDGDGCDDDVDCIADFRYQKQVTKIRKYLKYTHKVVYP